MRPGKRFEATGPTRATHEGRVVAVGTPGWAFISTPSADLKSSNSQPSHRVGYATSEGR